LVDGVEELKEAEEAVRLVLAGVRLPSLALPEPQRSSTLLSGLGVAPPKEGAFLRGVLPPDEAPGVAPPEEAGRRSLQEERGESAGRRRGVLPPAGEAQGVTCLDDGEDRSAAFDCEATD